MRCMAVAATVLLALCAGEAGAETPAQKAVGQAASAYAQELAFKQRLAVLQDPLAFNAPPAEIRAALAEARAAVVAEKSRLQALRTPNLRAPGMDLGFVAEALRAEALAGLESFPPAFADVEAALAAQADGDCAGMAAHLDALRVKVLNSPVGVRYRGRNVLEGFLAEFAGGPRYIAMPVSRSPEEERERAIAAMTALLSQRLRCPLSAPSERYLLTVRLEPNGTLVASLPDAAPDVAARVTAQLQDLRLTAFPRPPREMHGQTFRFEWADQRVRPKPG